MEIEGRRKRRWTRLVRDKRRVEKRVFRKGKEVRRRRSMMQAIMTK